jgi:DNA polymerase III subunit chi
MQVDFYQLTRDPVETILPVLASKILTDGGRLLVVSKDKSQLETLSAALWTVKGDAFLANALASGDAADVNQPILLSTAIDPANGARFIALADGIWRDEVLSFERAFYLFPPERTEDARTAWRKLGDDENIACNYWRQDGGKWVKGP